MKKRYLIPSLFLASLLASCNYGGIQVSSGKEFRNFYNSGDLATKKNTPFVIGDDASVTFVREEEGQKISDEFELSTSSISSWEGEKKYGNKLHFNQISSIKENNEELFSLENSGSVAYSTTNVSDATGEIDEETGEAIMEIIGKNVSYTASKTFIKKEIPEYNGKDESKTINSSRVYTEFYESPDQGETFSSEYSYIERKLTQKISTASVVENTERTERTTTSVIANLSITYTENYELSNVRYVLSYLLEETTTVTVEKKTSGVYEGFSRVVDTIREQTSYDETKTTGAPKGSRTVSHTEYTYYDYDYHKDEEHSSKTVDDDYRYEVTSEYIASFEVDAMVDAFKADEDLNNHFFPSLNNLMTSIFVQFEGFLNDSSIGEEIIRFASTYQYRAKVDANTIYQYSFLKGENHHDTISSVVIFDVNGTKLLEVAKANFIY